MIVTVLLVVCSALTRPELVTETRALFDVSQIASPVTSFVLPSLLVAMAESCLVAPSCRLFVEGLTVTVLTVGFTKKPVHPPAASSKPATQTAPISVNFRSKFHIFRTPRRRVIRNLFDPTAHKIVAERFRRRRDTVPTCDTSLDAGGTQGKRVLAEKKSKDEAQFALFAFVMRSSTGFRPAKPSLTPCQ